MFVTDGISFIAEYPLATGKPTIFMENPGHWEFSPIGEIAAAANVRVPDMAGLLEVFNEVRRGGFPDRSSEIDTLRKSAQPFPGQAGAKIVGHDAGPVRAPLTDLKPAEMQELAALIQALGPQ